MTVQTHNFDHDHTESAHGAFEVIARLFGAADVVIGYHGAGLVNAMFMRRHALVIEITTTFKSVRFVQLLLDTCKTPHDQFPATYLA